jgi:hypothetical protein
MRLSVLENGHRAAAAGVLGQMQEALGIDAAPGVTATLLYRPEYFGKPFADYLNDCTRGESAWSVGERELFAAFVSKLNQCPW